MSAANDTALATNRDTPWWSAYRRDDDPGMLLTALVQSLSSQATVMRDNTRRLFSIYQWGFRAGENVSTQDEPALDTTRNAYNAARNAIQTKNAKLVKTRITPMAMTEGASYAQRKRTKQLSKAIEGVMDENNWEEIKEQMVQDASVSSYGAGAALVFRSGDKKPRVRIEHIPIEELMFDETECRYRKPPTMYRKLRMDRYTVAAFYAADDQKLREKILTCPSSPRDGEGGHRQGGLDQIDVYMGWRLCPDDQDEPDHDDPEVDDERDEDELGRFTVAIDNATLVDEPYRRATFPVVMYVPVKRFRSIWGISDMYDLAPSQREYEDVTGDIQVAHNRMGVSGFLVPKGAKVDERDVGNVRGLFLEYEGNAPPQPFTVPPVHPDSYQYRDSIPRDMMTAKGISQLSAASQVPAGLSNASGKALQVFEDVESERMLFEHRELERMHVRLSWLIVGEAYAIVKEKGSYKTRASGKGLFDSVDWKEVMVDKANLVIKVFPVSALSKQPAAKFAQLQDMLSTGAITVEQFKRLYDLPDLDSELDIDTADTDVIDMNLDLIVTKGADVMPEGFDNLQLLVARAGKFYNLCRQRDVPDDRLELLRQFIAAAKALNDQAQAAAAPPPAPPGPPMPPGAMPPGPGAPPMPMGGPPPMAA